MSFRYGNDLCLLDATYKTSKYALPLFFLCVKTNVNYTVVGSFVVETESTFAITEALQVFKSWNPGWNPKTFMVDFSEAEINALQFSFKGMLYSFYSRSQRDNNNNNNNNNNNIIIRIIINVLFIKHLDASLL